MKRRAIKGLGGLGRIRGGSGRVLPRTGFALLLATAMVGGGCSGTVSSRTVRQQVAGLGGANLNPDDVQVQRIVDQLGGRTIAEANVRLAFQFEEGPDGEMSIVAVRLGNGEWLEVADLLAAIEAGNLERTRADMEQIVAGLDQYRGANGVLPTLDAGAHISDVLHPVFMTELVRIDAWGGKIAYEATAAGYELRSAGPDRIPGNTDDIVAIGGDGESGAVAGDAADARVRTDRPNP